MIACNCGGIETAHLLEEGGCMRKMAVGSLIPINFRLEVWQNRLQKVCTVNNYTITVFTLINQRLYHQHENGLWSLPKDEISENSI